MMTTEEKFTMTRITMSVLILLCAFTGPVGSQPADPTVLAPNLTVNRVASGLTTPTTMSFLSEDRFFVLEKNTGQVKLVADGAVQSVVLDLAAVQ